MSVKQAVRELSKADSLAFGGVGFAGEILPATRAFQAVLDAAEAEPDEVRERLTRLLRDGTAAGKAYAAAALERIDPAAGRAAWQSLVADDTPLTTFSGCVMNRVTLGEYAARRLTPG